MALLPPIDVPVKGDADARLLLEQWAPVSMWFGPFHSVRAAFGTVTDIATS